MRILLVEWDRSNADRRMAELRARGHTVDVEASDGQNAYRLARTLKPDVVVLDLAVKPSHSWQTARPLATRSGPRLIFVDGDAAAQAKAHQQAPTALFRPVPLCSMI